MGEVHYETFDVFTTTRFGGNPLAVVTDARGLDDATMQRIANEFNYSESVFVLPPDDPANTANVRIFTPAYELPFAGHPNVGAGYALARLGEVFGRPVGDAMRFEERAGLVEVEVLREAGAVSGARIRAPKAPEFGPAIDVATVAACASLTAGEVAMGTHEPQKASVGIPFAFAELGSLEALARAKPNPVAFDAANAAYPHVDDAFALFLYVRTGEDPMRVRARMFAPLSGIAEDPATGSASAALGALLGSLRAGDDGAFDLVVEQGVEMGRPSRIEVAARIAGGAVREVTIAGPCVPVMRGEIDLGG